MSEDTYKGESLQKKIARLIVHDCAATWMRSRYGSAWVRGLHVFLASREGGDVGALRWTGVPYDNMVGLDRNEAAIRACADKWHAIAGGSEEPTSPHFVFCDNADCEIGNINVCLRRYKSPGFLSKEVGTGRPIDVCPEKQATGSCWIERWADRSGHPFIVSAFLDFCSHLDRETVNASAYVCGHLSFGSVISVAVLKGREKRQLASRSFTPPKFNRRARRVQQKTWEPWRRDLRSMMAGTLEWNLGELVRGVQESDRTADAALARVAVLQAALEMSDQYHERFLQPISIVEYQSRTNYSNGVPMLIASFAIRKRFRDEADAMKHEPALWKLSNAVALEERNKLLRDLSSEGASLALNVEPKTATAWKAHATRGTYDQGAA